MTRSAPIRKPRWMSVRRSPCCIHTPESPARPTRSIGTIKEELHVRVPRDVTTAAVSKVHTGNVASVAGCDSCHAVQLGSSEAHAAQHAAAEADSGEVGGKSRSEVAELARRHTSTCREPQVKPHSANGVEVNSSSTAAAFGNGI